MTVPYKVDMGFNGNIVSLYIFQKLFSMSLYIFKKLFSNTTEDRLVAKKIQSHLEHIIAQLSHN